MGYTNRKYLEQSNFSYYCSEKNHIYDEYDLRIQ